MRMWMSQPKRNSQCNVSQTLANTLYVPSDRYTVENHFEKGFRFLSILIQNN